MARVESPDPLFAIRLIRLHVGWRYWAYLRFATYDMDAALGLEENGYATAEEAQQAVCAAVARLEIVYRTECGRAEVIRFNEREYGVTVDRKYVGARKTEDAAKELAREALDGPLQAA